MSDSTKHTPPQSTVDAAPAGGDDHKGARRGAIFIGIVLICYIVVLVVTGQVAQFWDALQNVQIPWLIVACICMVFYMALGVAAYAIAVWLDPDSPVGVRDLISVEMSGVFFGNLTPMMVGSSPAQIYRLTKCGMNAGEAAATQFTRFIVFQFGIVAWGAILLIARMPFFTERYGDITLLCVFSFGGHFLLLLVILAICLMPGTVIKVGGVVLSFLARIGVATNKIDEWQNFLDTEVYSFSEKFKIAAAHRPSMLLTVVITMIQLAFYYLVPYFLMLSFGHHDVDFFSVMAAAAFVQLLSSAVPLPGGTGGAEGGFALFLGHFFGSAATAGYLLWRLITFIAPTIIAAPLLGLKSAHRMTVRERWARFSGRLGGTVSAGRGRKRTGASKHKAGKHGDVAAPALAAASAEHKTHDAETSVTERASSGMSSVPLDAGLDAPADSGSSSASATPAAEQVEIRAKPKRTKPQRMHVRKTSEGITINPSKVRRHEKH